MTTPLLSPLFKGVHEDAPSTLTDAVHRLDFRTTTRKEWQAIWQVYRLATGKQREDVHIHNWGIYVFRPLRRDPIIRTSEVRLAFLMKQRAKHKAEMLRWSTAGHNDGRGERAGSDHPFHEDGYRSKYPLATDKGTTCQCCGDAGWDIRTASRLLCQDCLANKRFEQTII